MKHHHPYICAALGLLAVAAGSATREPVAIVVGVALFLLGMSTFVH